jgi:two-component system, OmpR family, sensor histidine kinase MprB
MSFRRRLALLTAVAVAATAVVSAAAVYVVVRHQLFGQVSRELHQVAAVHSTGGATTPRLNTPVAFRPPRLPRVISADGRIVAARYPEVSYPVTQDAKDVAAGRRSSGLEAVRFGSEHVEILTVPAGPGRAFQVAQSLESVDGTLHRLSLALLIVAGIGVLLAPLAGQAVAGGALTPVRRLTRTAGEITRTGDLRHRIETRGSDELASLGASFNAMLDRLAGMIDTVERAQRAQRQLVADASHELRTPLTGLRANVELLSLGGAARVDDPGELLSDTLQQLDGLTALVGQLVELAREDAREPERTPVRLDEVVEDALTHLRLNYPELEFVAELEPTTVFGSRDALSSAATNLLDNASKWSPAGGAVEVRLRDGTLEVRDHGPGIAEVDAAHVFDRFYRGAEARTRPGSGLGLAIVAQVVSSHGGTVRAAAAPGGGALLAASFPTNS